MTETAPLSASEAPTMTRVMHELRRRRLRVAAKERLTPHMIRITFEGADLEGFTSASPADHIKILLPDGSGGTQMRDYTPRRYDATTGTLLIDFAVHEAGPVTCWAINARVGDELEIGGPRGSMIIGGPIRNWLLIGDETALPSIGRRIEELGAGTPVTSLVAVPGPEDEQRFETAANLTALWVHRIAPLDAAPVLERLRTVDIPAGTFVWLAAEASVTRAIRTYLLEERGLPRTWLRAAGYWVHGAADATEKFED